ncbi:MAG: hypothetical protein KIT09_02645 [Bryobacteraceae bacterium]|nr:hypothetical protein [Bryobacteraceae bacterium]
MKNELWGGGDAVEVLRTNAARLRLAAISHNVNDGAEEVGAAGRVAHGAAEALAVPHLEYAGPAGASRAKDRAAFMTAARLAEWLEALKLLPLRV